MGLLKEGDPGGEGFSKYVFLFLFLYFLYAGLLSYEFPSFYSIETTEENNEYSLYYHLRSLPTYTMITYWPDSFFFFFLQSQMNGCKNS